MEYIPNRGWFVSIVSGLATGDQMFIETYLERGPLGIKWLREVCATLMRSGFARYSRKGWLTIEHPDLGIVSFKIGADFRTAKDYFFLRLNGREILRDWPDSSGGWDLNRPALWVVDPEKVPDYLREQVERKLRSNTAGW